MHDVVSVSFPCNITSNRTHLMLSAAHGASRLEALAIDPGPGPALKSSATGTPARFSLLYVAALSYEWPVGAEVGAACRSPCRAARMAARRFALASSAGDGFGLGLLEGAEVLATGAETAEAAARICWLSKRRSVNCALVKI